MQAKTVSKTRWRWWLGCLLLGATGGFANPCTDLAQPISALWRERNAPAIQRHLRSQLAPEVAPRVQVGTADILSLFHVGDWYLVYVETQVTDEPYLFYRGEPITQRGYRSLWAGSARPDEQAAIHDWVLQHTPEIPESLAACFAWYVTQRE